MYTSSKHCGLNVGSCSIGLSNAHECSIFVEKNNSSDRKMPSRPCRRKKRASSFELLNEAVEDTISVTGKRPPSPRLHHHHARGATVFLSFFLLSLSLTKRAVLCPRVAGGVSSFLFFRTPGGIIESRDDLSAKMEKRFFFFFDLFMGFGFHHS